MQKTTVTLIALTLGLLAVAPAASQTGPLPEVIVETEEVVITMPTFEEVEAYVESQFPTTVNYKPGDLITKSEVAPVLSGLSSIGWNVQRPDLILDLVLDDNDYLVKELRTRKGKKLYDKVAKYPGVLSHLDRMRDMHGGKKTLEVFVQKTPNNADIIKTLVTTKRGKRFAKDVAKYPNGKDFNKPTDRIYRVQELLISLRKLYDWELSVMESYASGAQGQNG
ncbi:MAG: hypothetical protein AAGF97_16820 [Planctomycetota bacterium]